MKKATKSALTDDRLIEDDDSLRFEVLQAIVACFSFSTVLSSKGGFEFMGFEEAGLQKPDFVENTEDENERGRQERKLVQDWIRLS